MKKTLIDLLSEVISPTELTGVYRSYDIVGDIAIIRLTDASEKYAEKIADAVMSVHRNVKTVLAQKGAVSGEFRLRNLTHVAGENRTTTVHSESGCLFSVDVGECYFSPRLGYERARIAGLVQPGETVVNMFAGAGCFSIVLAKQVSNVKVYSIDVNHAAVQLMTENIRLNRLYGKIFPILGDAKAVVEKQLECRADRVLMPLPEKALQYLPCAASALRPRGGWIHVYVFEHATKTENPSMIATQKIKETLDGLGIKSEVPNARIMRSTGPNWWQIAADVHVAGR